MFVHRMAILAELMSEPLLEIFEVGGWQTLQQRPEEAGA